MSLKGGELMRRLSLMVATALLAVACNGSNQVAKELTFNDYDQHCREHASDMYAEDFAPGRYMECMDLHLKGIVLTDSTDEHLAGLH